MDDRFDANRWAEWNFGENNFGDKRLNDGCVQIAQAMICRGRWNIYGMSQGAAADCAAAYRFMRNDATDAAKVTQTHRGRTREKIVQLAEEAKS